MKETIAQTAKRVIQEQDLNAVMWGDGVVTDIYGDYCRINGKEDTAGHPLARIQRVIEALDRSSLFEKIYIRGHDRSGNPRLVRGFKIKNN
jgi:hypothetical protein